MISLLLTVKMVDTILETFGAMLISTLRRSSSGVNSFALASLALMRSSKLVETPLRGPVVIFTGDIGIVVLFVSND